MSDPTSVLPFFLPAVALFVGYFVGTRIWRFFNDPAPTPRLRDQAKPNVPIPMYCQDCGDTLVSYRSMDGYDIKTGKPQYSFQRACGKATRNGGPGTPGTWPYCGDRAKQRDIAGGHTHTDLEQVSTDCPACVDGMLRDKVLTYEQALALYGKMQFKAEPIDDDVRDDLAALWRRTGGYGFPYLGSPSSKP